MPDVIAEGTSESRGGLRRWLPLIGLIALMALAFGMGWHKQLTLENIAANRDTLNAIVEQHKLLALLAYAGLYVVVVALSIPAGVLLTICGGLLFGVATGASVTVFAATIGATIVFLIAKTSLGQTLAERAGPWLEKFRAGFESEGLSYMLFLRLVPFPFWVINLAPALLGVPLRTFVVGTFFGIIPGTVAFSFLGDTLDRVIEKAKASFDVCVASKGAAACQLFIDWSELPIMQILAALTLIGVVALIPTLLKKWRERHATS